MQFNTFNIGALYSVGAGCMFSIEEPHLIVTLPLALNLTFTFSKKSLTASSEFEKL